MKKKLLSTIGVACAVVMGLSMTACSSPNNQAKAESYVSLDINPSIEITLDKNDKVLSIYGANEDGQVLLYGESQDLIGVSIETAVSEVTELAEQLGYFDENSVVNTTVTSNDQAKEDKLYNKINAKITAKGTDLGLTLKVDKEQAFSLVRKYKDYLEEKGLTEADLPISQFKLALSASETGEITLDAAIELDTDKLLEIVRNAHKQIKDYATREFCRIQDEKKAEYEKMVEEAKEQEYITYFLTHFKPEAALQSVGYTVYNRLARAINTVADQIDYIEDLRFYELPEQVVSEVMTALNVEDQTLIQNSNGKVTIASIEKYADRLIKNIDDETLAEQLSNNLRALLSQAELAVKTQAEAIIKEYEPYLQQAVTAVNEVIGSINQDLKNLFGDVVAGIVTDVENITTQLSVMLEDGLTSDDLRELADILKDKAQEMYDAMKTEINKAGKSLKTKVENAKKRFDTHKQEMENHLNEKANEFKNHLSGLKNQYQRP